MNPQAFLLTCQLVLGSVVLAVSIGCSVAVAIVFGRLGDTARRAIYLVIAAACVMPLYLHAAAWEAAAGRFGIARLTQTAAALSPWSGMTAAVWIHGLSGSAWVAAAATLGLRRLPAGLVEAASLEPGWMRRWCGVLLPAAAPWIAAGALWVAALAATEMVVADLYMVRTLADAFYQNYSLAADARAVLTTLIPSLPIAATLVWVIRMMLRRQRIDAYAAAVTDDRASAALRAACIDAPRSLRTAAAGWAVCGAALMVVVPLAGLVVQAGGTVTVDAEGGLHRSWNPLQSVQTVVSGYRTFADEYRWTLLIAASMGLLMTALATAILMVQRPGRRLNLLDLAVLAVLMVPAPVMSLGIVWFFRRDVPGFDLLYRQTLLPLFVALAPRSGTAAYLVMRVAIARLDAAVSDAARLECLSAWRRFWSIHRPRLMTAWIVSIAVAAAVAAADVAATLPVIPPGVSTVGVRLFELLHAGARRQEAALALGWVLIAILIAAIAAAAYRRAAQRK